MSFLDPQWTKDKEGKIIPFGPVRYKQITKEIYYITKNLHIPYSDVMAMTPRERSYLLEFMSEDAKKNSEMLEAAKQAKTSGASSKY